MGTKRIAWVDVAKGFAILFVMMGHANGIPDILKIWVYSFHMPLFFFLSGFVFRPEKYDTFKKVLIDKSRTLLLPMAIFSVILAVWHLIISDDFGISELLKHVAGIIIELRGSKFDTELWFITCLFITELGYWIICRHVKKMPHIIICLVLLSAMGFLYVRLIDHIVPWAFDEALIAIGFFGAGHLLKAKGPKLMQWLEHHRFIILLGLLATNCIAVYVLYATGQSVDMYANVLCFYPLFYLSAFSGILSIIAVSMLVGDNAVIVYIGKNTFIFYAFHKALFSTISKILEAIQISISSSITWWLYIIISCLILAGLSWSINHYMPWMMGRFKTDSIK